MKKSKIKMLTASACLALVGTASAAWVYAGTATASANIGVKVASYASAGSITVSGNDDVYLYLDKGSVAFKQNEGTSLIATYAGPKDGNGTALALDTGKKVAYTYTVTLKGMLAKYVEFAKNNTSITTDADSVTYRTSTDLTWESGKAITLPSLKWATDSDTSSTYDNFTDEASYIQLVETLFQKTLSADSGWNNNEDVDIAADEGFVKIDFKATVTNS